MDTNEQNQNGQASAEAWESGVIQELALSSIKEKRRARRWGIFFKFLTFAYLTVALALLLPNGLHEAHISDSKHTAVVNIEGVIAHDAEASADNVVTGLRKAFKHENTKGVILRINSPGGSPVQAGYINDEIVRLKNKHPDIKVYAVVTDICASGGYYIAVAADEIYVDKASIVGSIGVLMNSFGFVDVLDKLGVERRLLTAGEHKGIMDPFSPQKEFDRSHMKNMLGQIHQQFIDTVKRGRGDKLKIDDNTFSGLFWNGEESITLGLADAIGSSSYVAREIIGAEDIVDFTSGEDLFERFAKKMGAGAASTLNGVLGLSDGIKLH
ncbi:MAG: S49 family peptidase [Gammaproteobacteria bacterium]|nr:S49 family peptidase [Gammaproteobacteria bacterium]